VSDLFGNTTAPGAATRGVGRPVSHSDQLVNPKNLQKLARRRALKSEKKSLGTAQEKVRADPSAANVKQLIEAAGTRHGRRHQPELAAIAQHDKNLVKFRENGAKLCAGMGTSKGGKKKNSTHLLPVAGSLLEGCDKEFIEQFATDTGLSAGYLKTVLHSLLALTRTHTLTHTHTHTHTHTMPPLSGNAHAEETGT